MNRKPEILILGLGGTISAGPDEKGYGTPQRSPLEILETLPGAQQLVNIRVAEVRKISSRAITPQDMCSLARKIDSEVSSGLDGIVITHGTDTLEETAYALALQLKSQVPVVLTGAMRQAHELGADGPANLAAALLVAATPRTATLGPVVVMHDEIHLARSVTKTHTSRVASFASPEFGPVGQISEGRVHLLAQQASTTVSAPTSAKGADYIRELQSRDGGDYLGLPEGLKQRVELLWVAAGADGMLVEALTGVVDGLVVAGTGGGHVPPPMAEALEKAVTQMPVVLASRCAEGVVLEGTYGGPGSETHLLGAGLLSAGHLSPLKARLRLMIALSLGIEPAQAFPA